MPPGSTALRPGLPPGGQIRRLLLPGAQGAVRRSRAFTRDALADWQWLPGGSREQCEVAEDVLLLVSELVTNACLHAGRPTGLVLRCSGDRLRIEVSDASPVPPAPRPRPWHEAARPGGHGLHIVARLGTDWGFAPGPGGKTVWVEVAAP
ncbi:ATP-binding protein [Streptacidiphilus sp. PB12-B1b]|uniref:ATP-binding protein n=1 Tax=Streptacidiphilus sp. PB12-B1b TaxID=2705012 RepID=UPI001CDC5FFD|nr:ATP-binding protein [Streptacidiphilus sp. PB12-B1b]